MDKLERMFFEQKCFQERHFIKQFEFKDLKDLQDYINMNLLSCYNELAEIQNETRWKHKEQKFGYKKDININIKRFNEEIIDLWHFIMNLYMAGGGTALTFYQEYMKKVNKNEKRQQNSY